MLEIILLAPLSIFFINTEEKTYNYFLISHPYCEKSYYVIVIGMFCDTFLDKSLLNSKSGIIPPQKCNAFYWKSKCKNL